MEFGLNCSIYQGRTLEDVQGSACRQGAVSPWLFLVAVATPDVITTDWTDAQSSESRATDVIAAGASSSPEVLSANERTTTTTSDQSTDGGGGDEERTLSDGQLAVVVAAALIVACLLALLAGLVTVRCVRHRQLESD